VDTAHTDRFDSVNNVPEPDNGDELPMVTNMRTKVVIMSSFTGASESRIAKDYEKDAVQTEVARMLETEFGMVRWCGNKESGPPRPGQQYYVRILSGDKDRSEMISSFTTLPNFRVFLGGYGSAGVGINLKEAKVLINVEPSWNDATLKQARDRINRLHSPKEVKAGKCTPTYCYMYVAKSTTQTALEEMIAEKNHLIGQTIGHAAVRDRDVGDESWRC
jgi:hypothetical protein